MLEPLDLREDAALRRDIDLLCHRFGTRGVAEFLIELGACHLIRADIEILLKKYLRLDPKIFRRWRWWWLP